MEAAGALAGHSKPWEARLTQAPASYAPASKSLCH